MRVFVHRVKLAALLASSLSLTLLPAAAQEPGPYRIGAGDVIGVTTYGDAGLSGEFVVSPSGTIGYPIIGQIDVAGMTVGELGTKLETDLAEHVAGLAVSATIIRYAPVFVFGDVQTPGKYEYRPGMTALELMVLGGGLSRVQATVESTQIQLIGARQEYADISLQMIALEAGRARLQAEYGGTDFVPPAIDEPDPSLRGLRQSIIDGEATLFATRKAALEGEQAALTAQEKTYADEIDSITESIRLHNEEIRLLNEDVAATTQLVERGLTSKSNLREAERRLSSTRRDALELGSYLARAQQALLALQQKHDALLPTRRSEAASALQTAEIELARKRSRQEAVMDTMSELAMSAGAAAGRQVQRKLSFTITRTVDGEHRQIAASEQETILPGDILRAELAVDALTSAATVN